MTLSREVVIVDGIALICTYRDANLLGFLLNPLLLSGFFGFLFSFLQLFLSKLFSLLAFLFSHRTTTASRPKSSTVIDVSALTSHEVLTPFHTFNSVMFEILIITKVHMLNVIKNVLIFLEKLFCRIRSWFIDRSLILISGFLKSVKLLLSFFMLSWRFVLVWFLKFSLSRSNLSHQIVGGWRWFWRWFWCWRFRFF